MAYGEGDRGVGGWLAFFLVTLGIFTPAVGAVGLMQTLNDPAAAAAFGEKWQTLRTAEIAMFIVEVLACWFACYRFLRVFNWQTVRIGIGTLVFLALLGVLIEPVMVSQVSGIDLSLIYRLGGAAIVRPIVYTGLWSTYLLVSKRVRATYGEQIERAEIGGVFE